MQIRLDIILIPLLRIVQISRYPILIALLVGHVGIMIILLINLKSIDNHYKSSNKILKLSIRLLVASVHLKKNFITRLVFFLITIWRKKLISLNMPLLNRPLLLSYHSWIFFLTFRMLADKWFYHWFFQSLLFFCNIPDLLFFSFSLSH